MQSVQKLRQLQATYNSLSNDPMMDSRETLSALQSTLKNENTQNSSYASQKSNLSSQSIQAKQDLSTLQANINNLQSKVTTNQNSVNNIYSYLSDYRDSSSAEIKTSNEELAQKLIGELQQLGME